MLLPVQHLGIQTSGISAPADDHKIKRSPSATSEGVPNGSKHCGSMSDDEVTERARNAAMRGRPGDTKRHGSKNQSTRPQVTRHRKLTITEERQARRRHNSKRSSDVADVLSEGIMLPRET